MLAIDEVLQQGRYRIVRQFGSSGTGDVYQAYDNTLEIYVVLREIPVKLNKITTSTQLETLKMAFASEAKVLTAINHASFIHVRDYFSEIDRHYLVLESVDGNYLGEIMEENKMPFALTDVMNWADQLLDALNYLHTQAPPVIHHDIKPQNINVDADGKVKLLALSAGRNANAKLGAATSAGFDAAQLHYLPLEQIWGKLDLASQKVIANSFEEGSEEQLTQPADARSDLYALGASLYHLLTGQRPVDALERSIDLIEGKPDPLPSPSRLNPSVPPEVSYVLMKALEIKREKRFESAIMMRQVLKTSIVRVKEREAKEGKKILDVAPAPVAQRQASAPLTAGQLPPPNQVKAPAVPVALPHNQQHESIKARLREAEAQRLKAEERAAEAERRLREKEKHDVFAYTVPAASDDDMQVLDLPSLEIHTSQPRASAPVKNNVTEFTPKSPAASADKATPAAASASVDDFAFSYAENDKGKRGMWPVFAAAAAVLVIGIGGFGAWSVMSSGAASEGKQMPAAMSLSEPARTDAAPQQNTPPAENSAAPADLKTETTEAKPAASEAAPAAADPSGAPRTRQQIASSAAPAAKPAKPAAAPAAKSAPQKKAVTVDDLLSGN